MGTLFTASRHLARMVAWVMFHGTLISMYARLVFMVYVNPPPCPCGTDGVLECQAGSPGALDLLN